MATIGTFTKKGDDYSGHIETRLWHNSATIKAVKKSSEKAPDYRIMAGHYDIGAAWRKTSDSGTSYLSVTIDDPSFTSPISCRLHEVTAGGEGVPHTHELVWTRS